MQVLTMCVSTGPRICLICLLLSSWHAHAEERDISKNPHQYDEVQAKTDHEGVEDTTELYHMEKDYFLTKLMNKYGNGVEITYEGFEHLLYHLGLGGIIKFDHGVECHKVKNSSEFLQLHMHHNHSVDSETIFSNFCIHDHGHEENSNIHDHHDHTDSERNHGAAGHVHDHSHDHNQQEDSHEHNSEEHEPVHDENEIKDEQEHSEHDHTDHKHEHSGTDDHGHDHDHEGHKHEHIEGTDHDHNHEGEHDHEQKTGENEHSHEEGTDHDHEGEHDHNHGGEHDHNHDGEHNHEEGHEHSHEEGTDHDHNHDGEHDHDHNHDGEHDHNHEDGHDHHHNHEGEHDHDHNHEDGHDHDHNHEGEFDHDHNHEGGHDHGHDHVHKRHTEQSECLPANVMLRIAHDGGQPRSLTKEMFKEICPALIYQIDADSCHTSHSQQDSHGDHDRFHSDHDHDHDHDHDGHDHEAHAEKSAVGFSGVSAKVWGFSTIAVIIISLVGLLGVAVIPIMQKVFYNHMLQFLVALAVGALSGDALLHLFPHAIAGGHGDEHGGHGHDHSGEGHSHDTGPIYKGLLGLLGIYFFFFTERVLTLFTEYKRKKKQKKNRKKYMKDEELDKVGEKLANSECDGMMMSIHPNKALRGYADEAHSEHCTISFENTTTISHEHGQRQNCQKETCVDGDENTSMIGSDDSNPRPRGHGHGHSHGGDGVPNSVASVAWMVILGDGIHNLSDGLAIGAAFVNSVTGGFSTSIAVFCHELPHEIGDFAMLLRAGMTPKQALFYNCLSSILCFIGMLIGVAIGKLEGSSLWIFSLVGGMFLYIALVDMLPELSSVETKKGEHPLCHLLLQGIGMCIGAGIMLAIALYEEQLKTILD